MLFRSIQSILDEIKNSKNIMIYGAGIIGKDLLHYLLKQGMNKNNVNFVVSNASDNPDKIDEVSVIQIDDIPETKKNNVVVVAVREQIQYEIMQELIKRKFTNIIAVDIEIRKRLLY